MAKHVHRYKRINIGQNGKIFWVMKCQECTHYTPMATKLSCPLLLGAVAKCPRCRSKFVLDKRALRMVNPNCEDCIVRRVTEEDKLAEKILAEFDEGDFQP